MIEEGLRTPGAVDLTAIPERAAAEFQGSTYLLPTVIWCESQSSTGEPGVSVSYTSVVEPTGRDD